MNYLLHILVMINIYIILTQGFNILLGYSGLVSICQAAFYGIGAYTTALLMMKLKINFFIAVIFSIIISYLLSFIVSKPSLKLKGDYFILATMGFQSIIYSILYNWIDFTRGPYGIPGIPFPSIFGFTFDTILSYFFLSLFFLILIMLFMYFITNSQFGRVLKAIREDELATSSIGKDTISFKTKAFAISAAISSISGSLYACYVTYIDPTSFTIAESLFLVTVLAIGGSGNLKGPVVGSIILVILPEILRFLDIPSTIAPNIRMMIYALALIMFMRYRQRGVAGEYEFK